MSDKKKARSPYYVITFIILALLALFFLFPLYWIVTGSVKEKSDIIIKSGEMVKWIPTTISWDNFIRLFKSKTELFGLAMPMAIRWLFNSVFISIVAMILTCITSSLAGYALAKKRFWGKGVIFSLFVCAMALPKQVILIPLLREMSSLGLYDTIWAVIFPIVGWPFGVFLLKQFAEGIPTEMTEACRIDGASEWRTFTDVMFPMIKPGVGACAIFTFINSWNDYFMQLIMLTSNKNLTISLGIATMQGESSTDYGLLMAGAALASVPIIIVFLVFQKYFTKGITMGAVKG